jgi:hypothetical protein
MSGEDRGGARGEKLTAMCLRSLGRVRQLIEDHLLCERLDAQGIPLHPEPIALRGLLEELSGRRALELKGVVLDIPSEVGVAADPSLLDRVLESLLAMAGREGAEVRVSARGVDGHVLLRVEGHPAPEGSLSDPAKGALGDTKGRSLAGAVARRIAAALSGSLALDGGAYVLRVPGRISADAAKTAPP